MGVNDTYVRTVQNLGEGNYATFDAKDSATGAAMITEIGGTGAVDIDRETDPANDGSFGLSIEIDKFTNAGEHWHTQLNNFICVSGSGGSRIRVFNQDSNSIDVYVVGKETDS